MKAVAELETYVSNLRAWAKTQRERDFVAGNSAALALGRAAIALRHHLGYEGKRALQSVMEDQDLLVRSIAASHCLDLNPVESQKVLEAAAAEGGFHGPMAAWVLSEWRAGTKELPGGPVAEAQQVLQGDGPASGGSAP